MDIGFKNFDNRCMMSKKYKRRINSMEEVKRIFSKGLMKCLNVLALFLVIQTANSACIWVAYQPKFPEAANKFKYNK